MPSSSQRLCRLSLLSLGAVLYFLLYFVYLSGIYSRFLQVFSKFQWVDAPQFSTASQTQPFESGGLCGIFALFLFIYLQFTEGFYRIFGKFRVAWEENH